METFSLEEDDSGIFITQNDSNFVDNIMDVHEDEFVFPSSQVIDHSSDKGSVGHMHYSDISDGENSTENDKNGEHDANFE